MKSKNSIVFFLVVFSCLFGCVKPADKASVKNVMLAQAESGLSVMETIVVRNINSGSAFALSSSGMSEYEKCAWDRLIADQIVLNAAGPTSRRFSVSKKYRAVREKRDEIYWASHLIGSEDGAQFSRRVDFDFLVVPGYATETIHEDGVQEIRLNDSGRALFGELFGCKKSG